MATADRMEIIDLTAATPSAGVQTIIVHNERARGADGVIRSFRVATPPFDRACYWAAYQKYDSMAPFADNWPEGANRIQPLAVTSFQNLTPHGMFVLLRGAEGRFLALLPVVGPRCMAWFESQDNHLILKAGNLGTGPLDGETPILAWACETDPYAACHAAWGAALAHPTVGWSTRWRSEKPYPEAFRYLGWCSWEQYHGAISSDLLVEAAQAIEESGLPIRYMLIDDGHLDEKDRQLVRFRPNEKFPEGWAPLMRFKRPDRIRWMGLWLNFNGYWHGIHPQNDFGGLNEHFMEVTYQPMIQEKNCAPKPARIPRTGYVHAVAWYDAMIGAARAAGFDFVKVDNQAKSLRFYMGTDQPVEAAASNNQALETACARHMDGLINCMAHNAVCIFNTRIGGVGRCSEDYALGKPDRARRHLHNSYGNIPWLGQTLWGDHDMFHSNDPFAGVQMALSKALSGGPVYVSDAPREFVPENIRPLAYDDGELLRPLAPAAPLPESLFIDPFSEAAPYRVIAPLAGGAAAVCVYNLTEPERPVEGWVEPADYAAAGAMIQPPQTWAAPQEGLIVYDGRAATAEPLFARRSFTMPAFGDRLFLLCPVREGWAVIGRTDKYLSPAAVEVLRATPDELLVRMVESGPLRIWNARTSRVLSSEGVARAAGGGLWQVALPAGRRGLIVRLSASG